MKTLLLLRHAKAQPLEGYATDLERPLAAEGRLAARDVGRVLVAGGRIPGTVYCSTAARTRQTWAEAQAQLGSAPVETHFRPRLYEAGVSTILQEVASTAETERIVLVVGHEPTMSQVVLTLSGERPPSFRPGTLAVLSLPDEVPWSSIEPGDARLTELIPPGS